MMYEIPSIPINNSILYYLDPSATKRIYVTDSVKEKDVSLSEGQVLYFGGLCFIELIEGKKTPIRCYLADKIQLKKSGAKRAEEKFVSLVNEKAIKPICSKIKTVKDMDIFEIRITESNYRDIGIQGLGWFTFQAKDQIFRIYVPRGVSIYTSRPKVFHK